MQSQGIQAASSKGTIQIWSENFVQILFGTVKHTTVEHWILFPWISSVITWEFHWRKENNWSVSGQEILILVGNRLYWYLGSTSLVFTLSNSFFFWSCLCFLSNLVYIVLLCAVRHPETGQWCTQLLKTVRLSVTGSRSGDFPWLWPTRRSPRWLLAESKLLLHLQKHIGYPRITPDSYQDLTM